MAAGDVTISGSAKLERNRRIIWGTVTLDGGNPTPIDLSGYVTTVEQCFVTLRQTSTPGLDPTHFTVSPTGATARVYAWKPTGSGDVTLIASTNNSAILDFIATGAR